MSDKLPQRRGSEEVASFSAEATANFLSGGELGRPTYADAEVQQRMDRQRENLRIALRQITPILCEALHQDSPQTEAHLKTHLANALAGDVPSYRMYCAMLAELGKQALQP